MVSRIDTAAFRQMVLSAAAAIDARRQHINDLNVFPVPDGDTGTNMCLTLGAAADDVRSKEFKTAGDGAKLVASAMLRGARGNSGVILSLLFRGFSKSVQGCAELTAQDVANGMKAGVDTAYNAVMKPTEGTILTVSRLAAAAALKAAEESDNVEHVIAEALSCGWEALPETTEQNPILKKAGVVDAGAKGYLYILEGALRALQGEVVDEKAVTRAAADFSAFDTGDITFAYCTEFTVSRDNGRSPALLRPFLDGIGDSAVLVEDEGLIKVHVHTNEPDKVLSEALKYGDLLAVKIENMRLQHTEQMERAAEPKEAPPEKEFGFVPVCAGEGLEGLFRDLGADHVISGGQTMNPSTEDILRAIEQTPAETVFVFPNNKNIIMAAQQCVGMCSKNIVIIPTKTVPQGVTAMLSFLPAESAEENARVMTEAMASVHTLQITYAARCSEFDGMEMNQGDYLALDEGALLGTSTDIFALLTQIADKLNADESALISLYFGKDVSQEDADRAEALFAEKCPEAEVSVISGGQPVYYYIISAE